MNKMTSRANRRNRTSEDLKIKNKGSMFDLFDNFIKEVYRITDEEYDYIAENITEDDMALFVRENLTFGQKKQVLTIVEKHLENFEKTK